MPGAIIAIDQDQGVPSYGSPGVARNDLWTACLVTVRSSESGNTSYIWTLLDRPPGSAATLASATSQNATFTPDLPGSYRVQLTTNGGGPGNVQILIAAATKDNTGAAVERSWRVPALGEAGSESNFGGQPRSWDEAIRFILEDIRNSLWLGVLGDDHLAVYKDSGSPRGLATSQMLTLYDGSDPGNSYALIGLNGGGGAVDVTPEWLNENPDVKIHLPFIQGSWSYAGGYIEKRHRGCTTANATPTMLVSMTVPPGTDGFVSIVCELAVSHLGAGGPLRYSASLLVAAGVPTLVLLDDESNPAHWTGAAVPGVTVNISGQDIRLFVTGIAATNVRWISSTNMKMAYTPA